MKASIGRKYGLLIAVAVAVGGAALYAVLSTSSFRPAPTVAPPKEASRIEHVGDDTFKSVVLQANGPILVDFYADWCGPCQKLAPVLEEVSQETPAAKIVKVDVDRNRDVAKQYQIKSIPTLLVFRNGEVTKRHLGWADKESIKQMLAE